MGSETITFCLTDDEKNKCVMVTVRDVEVKLTRFELLELALRSAEVGDREDAWKLIRAASKLFFPMDDAVFDKAWLLTTERMAKWGIGKKKRLVKDKKGRMSMPGSTVPSDVPPPYRVETRRKMRADRLAEKNQADKIPIEWHLVKDEEGELVAVMNIGTQVFSRFRLLEVACEIAEEGSWEDAWMILRVASEFFHPLSDPAFDKAYGATVERLTEWRIAEGGSGKSKGEKARTEEKTGRHLTVVPTENADENQGKDDD